jgi:hypothetical protein
MARKGNSWPWPTTDWSSSDINSEIKKEDAALEQLQKDHDVLYFPVGDGYAYYVVSNWTPLTLSHVPFGDCWKIPDSMIRGLRIIDVRRQLQKQKVLVSLFS